MKRRLARFLRRIASRLAPITITVRAPDPQTAAQAVVEAIEKWKREHPKPTDDDAN